MWWCPNCETLRDDHEISCLNDGTLRESVRLEPPNRSIPPRAPEAPVVLRGRISQERLWVRERRIVPWPLYIPAGLLFGAFLQWLVPRAVQQPRILIPFGIGLGAVLLILGLLWRFRREMATRAGAGLMAPFIAILAPLLPRPTRRRRLFVQPDCQTTIIGVDMDQSGNRQEDWPFRAGRVTLRFTGRWIRPDRVLRATQISMMHGDEQGLTVTAAQEAGRLLMPAMAITAGYLIAAAIWRL